MYFGPPTLPKLITMFGTSRSKLMLKTSITEKITLTYTSTRILFIYLIYKTILSILCTVYWGILNISRVSWYAQLYNNVNNFEEYWFDLKNYSGSSTHWLWSLYASLHQWKVIANLEIAHYKVNKLAILYSVRPSL